MTSFFPSFGSSASIAQGLDEDPHLEVVVTPSASAFYAGETFSATITFRNTHPKFSTAHVSPAKPSETPKTVGVQADSPEPVHTLRRQGKIGLHLAPTQHNAEAGPSRLQLTPTGQVSDAGFPYSPGANPAYRAPGWPGGLGESDIRSPEGWGKDYNGLGKDGQSVGHSRRSRSLALGKGTMSPQEMVWALSGRPPDTAPVVPRRPGINQIPLHHPHSRKISVTSQITSPPTSSIPLHTPSPDLPTIPELSLSRPHSSRISSQGTTTTTTSSSTSDIQDDLTSTTSTSRTTLGTPTRTRPRISPSSPLNHCRTPSYQNAYGASLMGIPQPKPHSEPTTTTTILWAHTRLVGQFHPSNTHIPPDPLLPLRSLLLHQPIGSGSLLPSSTSTTTTPTSRWQLSFGTGTIGNSTTPSLTGSLFGLAKGLVYGGDGGSLEEERKRVWNMKDLPVFETFRSLLGVDLQLKEGESRDFLYTLQLPRELPTGFRGRAFRFTYDLVVQLNLALPGAGKRQRLKEISVPIRIWANISLGHPLRVYDVLKPIIQTKEEGRVDEADTQSSAMRRGSSSTERVKARSGDTEESLKAYAKHLLDTLEESSVPSSSPSVPNGVQRIPPLSPGRVIPRARILSPSSPALDRPSTPSKSDRLQIPLPSPSTLPRSFRPRQGSFLSGDDELVEGDEGCGEAVEILSRHSPKSSYDIAKDGDLVAVLTLIKTTYRLGESVLGVVTFNGTSERRVLKMVASLDSHEIIPETLLPLSPSSSGHIRQPPLIRTQAEHRSGYLNHTSRLPFTLDIPTDTTPAFTITSSPGTTQTGGLEWKIKLSFLVTRQTRSRGVSLLPIERSDGDNETYGAASSLAPMILAEGREWREVGCETIECEVPVRILPGNTAFLVRPSVHVV